MARFGGLLPAEQRVSEKNSSRQPGEQRQVKGPEVKRPGPVLSDPSPPNTYYLAKRLLLSLLSGSLDILDHCSQFCSELLVTVIDAVHVSTCPGHALNNPASLSDVLLAHLIQRKLRRVEGHSVSTVDSRGCPECDQSLVTCGEDSIAQGPVESIGVLLQHWIWHFAQEVGNETEILPELIEDLLPISHY